MGTAVVHTRRPVDAHERDPEEVAVPAAHLRQRRPASGTAAVPEGGRGLPGDHGRRRWRVAGEDVCADAHAPRALHGDVRAARPVSESAGGVPRGEAVDVAEVLLHRRRRPAGNSRTGEEPGGDPGAPQETLRGDPRCGVQRGRETHHGDEIHRRRGCPAARTSRGDGSRGVMARRPIFEHGAHAECDARQVPRREGLRGVPVADPRSRGPGALLQALRGGDCARRASQSPQRFARSAPAVHVF